MNDFSLDELKAMAKAIFMKAVAAVDPYRAIRERVRIEKNFLICKSAGNSESAFRLDSFDRVFLVGAGKAAASMARAIEAIFRNRITKGVITTKYGHALPLEHTETIEAGHPVPDENGVKAAERMLALLDQSGPDDLVVFLLSGGGSALLPLPADGITLEEKQRVTRSLLECGADIKEMNTLRKHISAIKGGRLARRAYPSTVLGFVLSDVVGDPLDVIGSGPAVPDPSTYEEAWMILKKYHLLGKIPPSIETHLLAGREGKAEETPKPGDAAFEKVSHLLIGTNLLALRAAGEEAVSLGLNTLILSSSIVGETREAARFHAAIAREVLASGNPVSRPACIISGGETTVTIKGRGLGGRNQEFALAGAIDIEGLEKTVLLSGGTDGTDGPTDAAGAIADHATVKRALMAGLAPRDHLENNDAYPFFQTLGDLLITGPTYTDVMDVRILLIG